MLDEMILLIIEDAKEHMEKTIGHLQGELGTIRAGRATPAMLDGIRVDFYGTQSPLNQVASVSAPQPDLLVVQPWDRSSLGAIEKAILSSNIGLNPSNDGTLIRVPVPPLSEERRRSLAKTARGKGEEAKIAVRNIRRHAKDDIKSTQKEEKLPEDMRYEGEDKLQKITDEHIGKISKLLEQKEAEIMKV